jgi:hypothetical protein
MSDGLGRFPQRIAAADRAVKSARNPVFLEQMASAYAMAGKKARLGRCYPPPAEFCCQSPVNQILTIREGSGIVPSQNPPSEDHAQSK